MKIVSVKSQDAKTLLSDFTVSESLAMKGKLILVTCNLGIILFFPSEVVETVQLL